MKAESFIITIISIAALPIFLFFRQLLDNKKSWIILLEISAGIASVGIVLTIFGSLKSILYLSFITPIFAIAIYRPLYLLFKKGLKREPIDTAFNYDSGLFYDRLFNIVYVLLSIAPIIGILYLYIVVNNQT